MASRERRRISGESYMSEDNSGHSLAGRTALVTGGARRLGAAIASAFHGAGANVVIHYRGSRADAEALAARLEARRPGSTALVQGDLLDTKALPGWSRAPPRPSTASTSWSTTPRASIPRRSARSPSATGTSSSAAT
jgi:hypothetical protein